MSDRADRPPHIHMDPVAALLNEHPPQLLSVTELHSNIALLEDAVRACSAELESRPTTLESMPDEMQQLVFGQLRNVLDPRDAVDFSSASKGLRELMQRIGEGASKSLLQQLQEEYEAVARALRLKARPGICCPQGGSCKAVREANMIHWIDKGDLAMLGKLIPLLPALESLSLVQPVESSDSAGPDSGQRLVEGLGVGALPAMTELLLFRVCLGDAGASALAAALDRGALPRLEWLYLRNAAIGTAGVLALAPALRRRPALKRCPYSKFTISYCFVLLSRLTQVQV